MQAAKLKVPFWGYVLLLVLGGLIAQVFISLGGSPYVILGAGVALLVFRRRVSSWVLRSGAKALLWSIEAPWPGRSLARKLVLRSSRAMRAKPAVEAQPTVREPERTYTAEEGAAFFETYSEPCAFLVLDDEDTCNSATQIGGLPRLPDPAMWPRSEAGAPIHFLMAVDLAAVPELDHTRHLPKTGILNLFFSSPEVGPISHAVKYCERPAEICPPPEDLGPVNEYTFKNWCGLGHYDARVAPFGKAKCVTMTKLPTNPDFSAAHPYNLHRAAGKVQQSEWNEQAPRNISLSDLGKMFPEAGYDPSAFGGHFPWTNQVAQHALAGLIQRHQSFLRPDGIGPEARAEAESCILACQTLMDRLGTEPTASLSESDFASFDKIMSGLKTGLYDESSLGRTAYAVLKEIRAHAVANEGFRASVPATFFEWFHPERVGRFGMPHMVGGPQDHGCNPSDVQGVRLFQVESDSSMGLMFGDCGFIEVWIDLEDLEALRFERTRLTLSSS